MHVHRPLLTLLLLLTAAVPAAYAQSSPSPPLAEVDRMLDEGRFQAALHRLEELHQATPGEADILWRMSRAKVDIGEQANDEDEQAVHYRAAWADADAAVEADPRNAQAHLARAIAAGRVGLISDTREKIELSREVKESVDRAIELDPENATAYHVRGRWNYEVADLGFFARAIVKVVYGGLPDASFEQAAADFRRAIELEDQVIHHLELGKTYRKLGREDEARKELEYALGLPDADPDDPGHKEEAREILSDL